eukprot:COSAG01_NODE_457_length_16751_cov_34.906918_9_plen_213_part_00
MELAELLLELHPWCAGGMVRYARGGGEINMLAARIARAATNRDRIAVCGYHGWTDWYIAANYQGDDASVGGRALAADARYETDGTGHSTKGVPTHLTGSAIPWDYGTGQPAAAAAAAAAAAGTRTHSKQPSRVHTGLHARTRTRAWHASAQAAPLRSAAVAAGMPALCSDRLEELSAIFEAYPGEVAAVMMEVSRSEGKDALCARARRARGG